VRERRDKRRRCERDKRGNMMTQERGERKYNDAREKREEI